MVQFCYLRLWLGTQTASFRLLLRMARIDMDWNLKELDDIFQVVKKSLWFIVLPDEFVWYVVDNSTAAYQLCMGKSMK